MKQFHGKVIIGNGSFDRTFTVSISASSFRAAMSRATSLAAGELKTHLRSLGNKKRTRIHDMDVSLRQVRREAEEDVQPDRVWFSHGGENA